MKSRTVAAVDLGATSGRVMLAEVETDRVSLTPVARFPNVPLQLPDGLHWNLPTLYRGVLDGLTRAFREAPELLAIGIDSWAVDYALLHGDSLLGLPFHYRDPRSWIGVEAVHAVVPPAELYARTGLQFLHFNTVYQLAVEQSHGVLESADTVLLIPDLIGYWLTGERRAERTNVSTTGLLHQPSGEWDQELARRLEISPRLLPELINPGDDIGALRSVVREEIGAGSTTSRVVAVGSHDTASAVAAIPLVDPAAAYISCGTWGLVGLELPTPVLSEAARTENFTNERAIDGGVRFLKNVMGLWLLSETLRSWERAGSPVELSRILREAADVDRPVPVLDVGDPRFHETGDMPTRIMQWCDEHQMAAPQTRPEMVRSILESLAAAFADAVRAAAHLSGSAVPAIHIVGGGALNTLLCQLTADFSGLPVYAGPVEATALGNALVQARAVGLLDGDAAALRRIVENSSEIRRYRPRLR